MLALGHAMMNVISSRGSCEWSGTVVDEVYEQVDHMRASIDQEGRERGESDVRAGNIKHKKGETRRIKGVMR
jgi:hypothetical protein